MKPDLITFDCAQTLLKVNWKVGAFAVDCARHVGLDLDETAAHLYSRLHNERRDQYVELNLTRDTDRLNAFWAQLSRDWLRELGQEPEIWQPKIDTAAKELGFGKNSTIFQLYDDVLPCLERLKGAGVRLAVISNWDYSLHNILQTMEIYHHFEKVVASLEEGYEKPDPRIFLKTLEELGVEPSRAVHIGDDPIDDLQGARNVGMRAFLIDRSRKSVASPPYIASLLDIPEALGWSE